MTETPKTTHRVVPLPRLPDGTVDRAAMRALVMKVLDGYAPPSDNAFPP